MTSKDHDAVQREYARLAAHYDRRWSFYIEATTRETVGRFEVKPGDRVLDVGCGTGALLNVLSVAVPEARLAGVDPSPEMLEVARAKLGSSVELRQSRAEGLPYHDEMFEVVVSTSVLHFIRNPVGALREMFRVLRPEGRVVITDWCDDYLTCRICDLILRVFSRAHFRVYDRKECRELLEESGFTSILIERYKIDWLWGLMTAIGEKREAQQAAVADQP